MPVMAEVDFFTTMNGSPNTSLKEVDQCGDKGSSPVKHENSSVVANDLYAKLGNGESNSGTNVSVPAQDGEGQHMEGTGDSVAADVKQTSSKDSLDMSSDLGNNEDSKTQCSNAVNQEFKRQTLVPHASESSEQKSDVPLPIPLSVSCVNTTSPNFTRSTKKARLSSPVTHEGTAGQNTTCSLATSEPPSTSYLANSPKAVTTLANSLPESVEPALTISAPTAAQHISQVTTSITSAGTSSTSSLPNSSKPITISISMHDSSETTATISAPVGALDVSQTTAINSAAISVPVSQMVSLPTIPAPFSNQVFKQDDPGSTSSIPGHCVTPQMLSQALAMCTLPMNASAASTVAGDSSTSLATPSLANKIDDLEGTSVSNNVATTSSFPSTINSKTLVAIPVPMTKLEPEVPIASSNVVANATQTSVAANPTSDNSAPESMPIANSSTASPDIPAIFPGFTPCSKCNSILVCSCPGPSSIGEVSGAIPATCEAGCQDDCKCNGMKANQVDGLNPSEQDVKPQIYPVVVSLLWILNIVFLGDTYLVSLSYTDDVFKDVEENTRSKILQTYAEGVRGRNQSDL